MIEAEERAEAAETKLAELEPKAEFYDKLMSAEGTYTWQEVAGMFGLGRNTLTAHLKKMRIIQDNLLPYAHYRQHFKILSRTRVERYTTGALIAYAVTRVTPSGMAWLRRRLMQEGVILPAKTELCTPCPAESACTGLAEDLTAALENFLAPALPSRHPRLATR